MMNQELKETIAKAYQCSELLKVDIIEANAIAAGQNENMLHLLLIDLISDTAKIQNRLREIVSYMPQ